MPELPEVQTVVNDLITAGIQQKVVCYARVRWYRSIQTPAADVFCKAIEGLEIRNVWRRAKYIVFDLSAGKTLLLHLRMSGRMHLLPPQKPYDKHEHVIIGLANGSELRLHDTRKFARFFLLDDPQDILGPLGIEPLEPAFTLKRFETIMGRYRRMLKPLLLDQRVIAGLGNIYVDEALWEARIHPCRTSDTLTSRELKRLHRAIKLVLKRGLDNLGTTLGTGKANFYSVARRKGRNSDQLNVFRRTGQVCSRSNCNTLIERIIVGQRSTHICSSCQS